MVGLRGAEALVSPRRELRRATRVAAFGATTGVMLPAFLARMAVAPEGDRGAVRDRWVRLWSRTLLETFGVRALIRGTPPAGAEGRLVVANHRSTADILLLLGAFGGAMVSRADVAGWPLIGAAARAVGTVFVDRSSAFSGATAVRAIRTRLSRSSTVIVFPEGGTSAGDEVRPGVGRCVRRRVLSGSPVAHGRRGAFARSDVHRRGHRLRPERASHRPSRSRPRRGRPPRRRREANRGLARHQVSPSEN
jgi:1-acyl-sn-glycerol-3-phosphate acyltransferase